MQNLKSVNTDIFDDSDDGSKSITIDISYVNPAFKNIHTEVPDYRTNSDKYSIKFQKTEAQTPKKTFTKGNKSFDNKLEREPTSFVSVNEEVSKPVNEHEIDNIIARLKATSVNRKKTKYKLESKTENEEPLKRLKVIETPQTVTNITTVVSEVSKDEFLNKVTQSSLRDKLEVTEESYQDIAKANILIEPSESELKKSNNNPSIKISFPITEEKEENNVEISIMAKKLMLRDLRRMNMEQEWIVGKWFGIGRALSGMRLDEFLNFKAQSQEMIWLSDLLLRAGRNIQPEDYRLKMEEFILQLYQTIVLNKKGYKSE